MKIMMAAPYNVNGRYSGGIASIANTVLKNKDVLDDEIIKFETCRINRKNTKDASISIVNIKNSLCMYKDIIKEIKKHNPDVLYFHTSVKLALLKDLLVIRHAKRKTNISTVAHIHFADYKKIMTSNKFLNRMILSLLRKYVDHVVFLSKKTKKEFIKHGLNQKRCSVIYNFSSIECSRDDIIRKHNSLRELVFIGSIDKRKGVFDLFDALDSIDDKNIILNICGSCLTEEDEECFEKYLSNHNSNVIYHGYVDEIKRKDVLLKSDVLVLPSYGEGFPMVIMEAYSTGCMVISTNVGAIPEILNESNGFIISPGNVKALGECIESSINMSDDEIKKIQINNYDVSQKYSLNKFLEMMVLVCRGINK